MNMQGKEDLLLILNEQTFPIIEQITMGMPGMFFIYHADEKEELVADSKEAKEAVAAKNLNNVSAAAKVVGLASKKSLGQKVP